LVCFSQLIDRAKLLRIVEELKFLASVNEQFISCEGQNPSRDITVITHGTCIYVCKKNFRNKNMEFKKLSPMGLSQRQ
jgi:hypothetical protein